MMKNMEMNCCIAVALVLLLASCGGNDAAAPPGDSAKYWGAAELIETGNFGDAAYPQVAMADDGSALAVWHQPAGGHYSVWANRYDGTSWGVAEVIETDDLHDATYPQIAMAADGSALAVWHQDDGTCDNIWANRFDGTAWGVAELIETDNAGNARYAQIAMASDGSALAVWRQNDGLRQNIRANRFDGTAWGAAELIETDSAGDAHAPQIAMASDGSGLAVWYQYDGTCYNIWANRFDGTAWGAAELVETDDANNAANPQIAMTPDGTGLAVWGQSDSTRLNIRANRFDGTSWGTAVLIETDDAGDAGDPQIAMASDGSGIAVWHQDDGTRYNVRANRFDGTSWGTAGLIETDDTNDAGFPQIAMAADGSGVAVWVQSDGTRDNIRANRFNGTSWGEAELLETDDAGHAADPQIAMADDGRGMAVWYQSDGAFNSIWANGYE